MIVERSRITGKGQVQVPARIRKDIGASIGDELTFMLNDKGEIRVKLVKKRNLSELAGAMSKRKTFPGIDREHEVTKKKIAEKVAKDHEQK